MTRPSTFPILSRLMAVLILAGLSCGVAMADDGPCARVLVNAADRATLQRLAEAGIPLEDAGRVSRGSFAMVLSPAEIIRVRGLGIPLTVLDLDAGRLYADRARLDAASQKLSGGTSGSRFHLGSMGGFLTLAEVEAELDSMRHAYPSLISFREAIGLTTENRTIWSVRISRNPDVEEPEPRVLFTALHHAREPQGMMTLLHTMWYLLEQYGTNEDVTDILDHRELTFVPVVNPDGYYHNQTTNPGGGGMWRKNRRMNADGSIGVDLNRNYGYKWGADNSGSSAIASFDTYRGPSAFSEPETAALRDLCATHGFNLAINYHSYGNVLIYPWGYSSTQTPDSLTYQRLAGILTARNYYSAGTGIETVGYETNGDADDWMYGERSLKPLIYAMTFEVGNEDDSFWPAPSRILPIAENNLSANLMAARLAGECFGLELLSQEQKHDNDTITLSMRLVNTGVQTVSGGVNVQLYAKNGRIQEPSNMFVTSSVVAPIPVRIVRMSGTADGTHVGLVMQVSSSAGKVRDSITVRAGVPLIAFSDGADSGRSAWNSSGTSTTQSWDTTGSSAFSGRYSYTDSPSADYTHNGSSTFTMKTGVVLAGAGAELRFRAHWDIEGEYDIALVEASTDGGLTWTALPGRYTRPGSGAFGGKQIAAVPGFDRTRREWVEETMNLDQFLGSNIRLRFRLESDPYVQRDGIYVDDIRVLLYRSVPTAVRVSDLPVGIRLDQNYPNPFNGQTRIRFAVHSSVDPSVPVPVTLSVLDVLGRTVAVLFNAPATDGEHEIVFDAGMFPTGVYFCRLNLGSTFVTKPMVLLR